nr:uncharacterized protein LOC129279352 [Lytechinus pictus]
MLSDNEAGPDGAPPVPAFAHHVQAVAIKLPPFWRSDPLVWFAQAEAQFVTRAITQEATKYAHVIAALPEDVAQEICDILVNPPATNQYSNLKKNLIARVSASGQRRVQLLLTEEELGDRKPWQLLRRMDQLLGEQKLEKRIFKQLFLQRLPVNVRQILASTSEALLLSELAALADRIVETQSYTPGTISAIAPGNAEATPKACSDLESQVSELTRLVRDLTTFVGSIQRSRSRSRSRKRDNRQVADALSRPEVNVLHTLIAQTQKSDPELQAILNAETESSMALQSVPLIDTGEEICNGA